MKGFWKWFADKHFGIVLGIAIVLSFIIIMLFFVYVVPVLISIIGTHIPDIVILVGLISALIICLILLALSFWWEYQDDIKPCKLGVIR